MATIQSMVFVMIILILDHEENHLDDLCNSSSDESSVESLSDETTTSSDDSFSTVSSQALSEADFGDLDGVAFDGDEDEDDDGDEDCYDDEDLDDELIPRSVSKKLKRQRLCKVGKRTSSKIPFTQLKRGCISGKHGLGIRFRC